MVTESSGEEARLAAVRRRSSLKEPRVLVEKLIHGKPVFPEAKVKRRKTGPATVSAEKRKISQAAPASKNEKKPRVLVEKLIQGKPVFPEAKVKREKTGPATVSAEKSKISQAAPASKNEKRRPERNSASRKSIKREVNIPTPSGSKENTDSQDFPVSKIKLIKTHQDKSDTSFTVSSTAKNESSKVKNEKSKKSIIKKKSEAAVTQNMVSNNEIVCKKSFPVRHAEDSDDFSVIEKKIFEGVGKKQVFKAKKMAKGDKTKDRKISVAKSGEGKSCEKKHENLVKEKQTSKVCDSSKSNEFQEGNKKCEASKIQKSMDRESLEKSVSRESKRNKSKDQSKDAKKRERSKDSRKQKRGHKKAKVDSVASESDASDWEEVEEEEMDETKELLEDSGAAKVKESVKIELDAPDLLWGLKKRKRRTEEEMIEDYLRKSVNRSIKEVYENMHKTHLLCLLAHGRYLNQALNSDVLLGAALSLIVDKNAYPPKRLDLGYLQKFVSWFGRKITVVTGDLPKDYWSRDLDNILGGRFESKSARTNRELVLMFVVFCRALGINVRLVLSFQALSWKPGTEMLIKKGQKADDDEKSKQDESKDCKSPMHSPSQPSTFELKAEKKEKRGRKMLSSDSDNGTAAKQVARKKKSQEKGSKWKSISDDDEDSDFDPNQGKVKKGPKAISSRRKSSEKRKSTEGDGEGGGKKKKGEPLVEWAEVYVEEEEKWVCVDVTRGKIHSVAEIEARMPSGSAYITAFNANLTVRDVTRRYVSSWLSSENKLRCDSEWWGVAVKAFRGKLSRLDKEEEKELDQNLKQQPQPKSIGEYKNHPLYALQRHLLKFEAIYPPNESPLGFIRGEAVYPRESVRSLHSRETWMKEAKSVRVGEEPYKIVKARPKWDRNTCQIIKDRPLELFGEWQVEDYEPPVAKNGKVPRNDYGNVELFKPSMLPRGCVHLPINGLNKLARKLNIDCAPAMVGFDFHSGWTHPVYDGYVVCEEFKDTLLDAWNEEQAEQARRAEEKRQKRVYDNWRKLIKGMIVRARVREEYKHNDDDDDDTDVKLEKKEDEQGEEQNQNTKKRIKQEDIDALRSETDRNRDEGESKPPLITHTVKNLKIDLSSNVVEMAKKSRQRTMRTKNTVRKTAVKKEDGSKTGKAREMKNKELGTLSDDESGTDEEEKKEKIRAILNWGTDHVAANPELSDDSDAEGKPSSLLKPQFSNPFFASIINPAIEKAKKVKKKRGCIPRTEKSEKESESEEESEASSRSTTPEPDVNNFDDVKQRKLSSRCRVNKNTVTYIESEGDISLDSSDCEDRTYDPAKERK